MTDNPTQAGIRAGDLDDGDLVRELQHLHEKRYDMLTDGTADQFRNNIERTTALEREYVRRFADRTSDAEAKAAALP